MAKFKYKALDINAKTQSGSIDAANESAARALLIARQLKVTEISEEAGFFGGGKGKKSGTVRTGKVKIELLTIFTRQLATLLKAGLPLLRALEILRKQEKNQNLKNIVASLCENVQSGNNISESMMQHSKAFDYLYTNMIRAGEAGGVLDRVLDRLAGFMEKSVKLKKKVKSAMTYPVVVVAVAVGIVYLLMVKVIPTFESMLAAQKTQLPELTRIVVGISRFLTEYWYALPFLIFALVTGGKAIVNTKRGKRILDKLIFRIPKVGTFVTVAAVARFARTFGTLMASGVPILQAITITRDTMGNVVIGEALTNIHDRVRDGEPLSVPLEQSNVFPAMVVSMIQVGEETGQLPEMLNRVADTYDEEVDNTVSGLTSIIEPLLIVFLAAVVGTIVIAMFLPMISLIQNMMGK
ncbi:MAG: type II secretion system F family protein [Puniceicoccales bacterium]|jgi:type IV pilus assembly protein PilC|nr:type II secretion system F family protein [Puniceicoccales bacterium]